MKKRKFIKEDISSTPSSTPTGNNFVQKISSSDSSDNEEDKDDPMIDYILQQIKQNKDKLAQDEKAVYAYRQQQAEDLVKDIEEYLKNNKK
jgi:5-methylthioribose kinase